MPPTPEPMMQAVRSDSGMSKVMAGMRDRLARRHHRDLRDAVERRELALLEMLERIEVLDLGDDFLA